MKGTGEKRSESIFGKNWVIAPSGTFGSKLSRGTVAFEQTDHTIELN